MSISAKRDARRLSASVPRQPEPRLETAPVNVAEALRKRPQPPSWTQREFTSALIALVKMDQPKARRHAKMNVIQTLAEAAPREFTGGAYHDSVAYRDH